MKPEEKKADKTYILELTDAQAKLVETALEEYFRLRMGQYFDFADEMAFQGFNYKEHTDEAQGKAAGASGKDEDHHLAPVWLHKQKDRGTGKCH